VSRSHVGRGAFYRADEGELGPRGWWPEKKRSDFMAFDLGDSRDELPIDGWGSGETRRHSQWWLMVGVGGARWQLAIVVCGRGYGALRDHEWW
jgi:hypothetical protein